MFSCKSNLGTPLWDFNNKTTSLILKGEQDASILSFQDGVVGGPEIANLTHFTGRDLTFAGITQSQVNPDCQYALILNCQGPGLLERVKVWNMISTYANIALQGGLWRVTDCDWVGSITTDPAKGALWSLLNARMVVEFSRFVDVGTLNGNTFFTKTAINTSPWFRHDDSEALAAGTKNSLVEIRGNLWDEGTNCAFQVTGGPTARIAYVHLEGNFANTPILGNHVATGLIENVDRLDCESLIANPQAIANPPAVPILQLNSVARARCRKLVVNPTRYNNFIAADSACGSLEIEDSPGLLVQSDAARTLIKTSPINNASAETGLPPEGQQTTTTVIPVLEVVSLDFPMVDGTYSGRLSVIGRLITPGLGGGSVGDSSIADFYIRTRRNGGVTTLLSGAADGPVTADASLVGTVITPSAGGSPLTVTIDDTATATGNGGTIDYLVTLIPDGNLFRAFDPTNLVLWLEADQGVTQVAGVVSSWADQSGIGDVNRDQIQAVIGNRPTWNAADVNYNGQPTISFNSAVPQWLYSQGVWVPTYDQPYTFFAVGNDDGVGANNELYLSDFAANAYYFGGIGGTFYADSGSINLFTTTARGAVQRVVSVESNPPNTKIYMSAITEEVTGNCSNLILSRLSLGGTGVGGLPLNGTLAAVLVFKGVLTLAERTRVLNYLGTKYGIAIGP
jgi:hypothetical protein